MRFWYLFHYASIKGSDESAHLHSLPRTVAACIHKEGMQMKAQTEIQASRPNKQLYMHVKRITNTDRFNAKILQTGKFMWYKGQINIQACS